MAFSHIDQFKQRFKKRKEVTRGNRAELEAQGFSLPDTSGTNPESENILPSDSLPKSVPPVDPAKLPPISDSVKRPATSVTDRPPVSSVQRVSRPATCSSTIEAKVVLLESKIGGLAGGDQRVQTDPRIQCQKSIPPAAQKPTPVQKAADVPVQRPIAPENQRMPKSVVGPVAPPARAPISSQNRRPRSASAREDVNSPRDRQQQAAPRQAPAPTLNHRSNSIPTIHPQQRRTETVNGEEYQILKLLGRGGSSQVYQALRISDGLVVAIKEVSFEGQPDVVKQSYKNEVALLKSLQGSPHIIKLYACELKEKLYIVLEKGDTDMATYLRDSKQFDPHLTKYYWNQMLKCVEAIHERNIVHSDLKPANFLIVRGFCKLIDFGIAAPINMDHTSAIRESPTGTYNYMAPEMLNFQNDGNLHINLAADVWSLGCILYYMVYRKLPFEKYNNLRKLQAIINPDVAIEFPKIDDDLLYDVIQRCLTRDRKQRPTVQELLRHPYLEGGNGSNSSLRSFSTSASLARTPSRVMNFDDLSKDVLDEMASVVQANTPRSAAKAVFQLATRLNLQSSRSSEEEKTAGS